MSFKKMFANDFQTIEQEVLSGVSQTYPDLYIEKEKGIVLLNRNRKNRVGILIGGGSGHEPYPFGFVGEHMATAAVCGKVFTSPPSSNIATAINYLHQLNQGVLVIILNYTGDLMNFGIAIETSTTRNIEVDNVVVADDYAISGKEMHSIAGRRGICGVLFVLKIAGAMSTAGRKLEEIVLTSRSVCTRMGSMGVCISSAALPGKSPLFQLNDDEIEIGVGIHGERGISNIKMCTAEEIVKLLLHRILNNIIIKEGDKVAVIVNNLGSSSVFELYIIVNEVKKQLVAAGYEVMRMYFGTLMTSLNMGGFQISILNITSRDEWLEFLDLPTEAFAWPGSRLSTISEKHEKRILLPIKSIPLSDCRGLILSDKGANIMRKVIKAACLALKNEEILLNQLDTGCGDGDTGTTFATFATEVIKELPNINCKSVSRCMTELADLAERNMGGTSGALYSLLFIGASRNPENWSTMWINAIDLLRQYSSAKLGYKTLLDSLIPACQAFTTKIIKLGDEFWAESLKDAVENAIEGCNNTKYMLAKAGKASYVDPAKYTDVDSGAYATTVWLKAIYETLIVTVNQINKNFSEQSDPSRTSNEAEQMRRLNLKSAEKPTKLMKVLKKK